MKDFPTSADQNRKLARKLVRFLRKEIGNTHSRKGWTKRNIELLQRFADREELGSCPDKRNGKNERQFLWDYVAYAKGQGLAIVAESEHDNKTRDNDAFRHDFEKLLYVRSPVKLMLCWAKDKAKADELLGWVSDLMQPAGGDSTCTEFSPAEVFVLYCTCSDKQDFVYWLQIDGKPMHRAIKNERFNPMPRERTSSE